MAGCSHELQQVSLSDGAEPMKTYGPFVALLLLVGVILLALAGGPYHKRSRCDCVVSMQLQGKTPRKINAGRKRGVCSDGLQVLSGV